MKHKIKFHCKQPWQTHIECSQQILILDDWHSSVNFGALSFSVFVWQLAMCNDIFSFCPVPVNVLATFYTGSSNKTAVPRNISIFNCTLDAKTLKLTRLHVEEPRLLPNTSWSHMKMCLKYLNHFSNITRFSHWL